MTWIHTKAVFTHPEREDIVVEGDRKENAFDLEYFRTSLLLQKNGFTRKEVLETKTPNLSVEP